MCLECNIRNTKEKKSSMVATVNLEKNAQRTSKGRAGEKAAKILALKNTSEMEPTEAPMEIVQVEAPIEAVQIESSAVVENLQSAQPLSTVPLRYFVQSNFVNVRSGPGTGFGLIGSLTQGQMVAFRSRAGLDRSPAIWSNGWGWVRFANSESWVAGWSGTGFNQAGAGHLLAVHETSFECRIGGQVNFRTGPGTEFPTSQIGNFLSLTQGMRIHVRDFIARNALPWSFSIPSRDLSQIWLHFTSIETPNGDTIQGRGWVRADLVEGVPANSIQTSGPLMGAMHTIPRSAVVISPTLNRRSGPGTHTQIIGQHRMGDVLNATLTQQNITEDRVWLSTDNASWIASENTAVVERVSNRVFRVNAPQANIRNAPDVSGTTVIGTQPSNTRLRITHRRRVTGGMDWFRFDQVIDGAHTVGWIADVNGFVEGEVGSPGIRMAPNAEHPQSWIDSRPVSLRNPDYIPGHTTGIHRPFDSTRDLNEITQIVIHHTASSTSLTRLDIEAGWRELGWWNGGYHEMIHADGTVEVCYHPEVVTNGAYGQNSFSYHISLVGNFRVNGVQPTDVQMSALTRRVRNWQRRLGIANSRVVGHSERTPTICPGMDINAFRQSLDGESHIPGPPTPSDLPYVQQILRDLPQRAMNVLGFGSPLGIANLLPDRKNVVQKRTFMPTPGLLAQISFKEVLATSNPIGFDIVDGNIKRRSEAEDAWNLITQFIPAPSINLLNFNDFADQLGRFVVNGTADVGIEPGVPFPWLVFKAAAEYKLPSGNKLKFEIEVRLTPICRHRDHEVLALDSIPIEVDEAEVEAVERSALEQAGAWVAYHLNRDAITFLVSLIMLAAIGWAIAKFLGAIFAMRFLEAVALLQRDLLQIFTSRGLEAEINLPT